MAREIRTFHVVVPAATLQVNPARFNLTFPPREVREIEVVVPPGPRGTVGFQIAQAGAQVFPSEPGAFFISDDERITWPIENANTSGAWQVIAYNEGQFDHALEFRFLVDLPGAQAVAAGQSSGTVFLDSSGLAIQPPGELPAPELPPGAISEPPGTVPPGVPQAPTPPSVPGPQAPPLPGLPPPPPLPGLTTPPAPGDAVAAWDQGEANTQALIEAQAAGANLEALLNELEARDQIAHENALGDRPTPPAPDLQTQAEEPPVPPGQPFGPGPTPR